MIDVFYYDADGFEQIRVRVDEDTESFVTIDLTNILTTNSIDIPREQVAELVQKLTDWLTNARVA